MEIKGNIIKSLPSVTGQGRKGQWIKRSFVIALPGPDGGELAIDVMNEKGDVLKTMKKGQEVRVTCEIKSREYNGKYYTSVTATRIEAVAEQPVATARAQPRRETHVVREPVLADHDEANDLPF